MLFSPSIFQHLLWVLHTTLGSNPVAMGVEYAGIHQASKTLKNTLGFIGIPEYKLVKPSERLDHKWNTKNNIQRINSFFLTWHTLWPKLTQRNIPFFCWQTPHLWACWPASSTVVQHLQRSKLHITNDPTTASNSAAGKGKDSAQPCTAWKSTPGNCCESAVRMQKMEKTTPRNQEIQIRDHFRFRQTKVQIHRFPFQKRINLSLSDRIFEASPKTRLWGTAKWGRTSK